MPVYRYKDEQGRPISLNGDSPPTEQELEEAFAFKYPTTISTATVDPSVQGFIQSQQAGPVSKAVTSLGDVLNAAIVQPVKGVFGTVAGAGSELINNPPQSLEELITMGVFPLRNQGVRNIAQSGLEAGGRTVLDVGNALNQLISRGAANVATNPLQAALETVLPAAGAVRQLTPSTPNEQQINQFLEDQLRSKQLEAVKTDPLVPEIIGETSIPLAEDIESGAQAIPLAGPVLRGARAVGRAVASPITRAVSRMAPATVEQSAISSLGLGPDDLDQVLQKVPTAVERTLQTTSGKVPNTAQEAIDAMGKTRKRLYEERLSTNKAAEERGLKVSADQAIKDAEEAVNAQTNLSPAKKEAIIKELRETYSGEKTASQGQKIQEDLNDELSKAYSNETIDQLSLVGKKAVRDSVARQMDEISQAITGTAETPYADIGNLIEVQGNLESTLNQLRVAEAGAKTGIKKAPSRIPTTKVGAVSKVTKSVLTPFQKTQIENLNSNVKKVFGNQPARPPRLPLEQGTIDELIQSRSSTGAAPAADLERQIQALIQSYPRALRSDPSLARLAAESELGIRPNVAP